ncbi:hypothetical protein JCGZ_05361 [Jatropha curcas]|uniref:HMA domain-containing protein n=1 Tax=Jatropha curcas TaxID=180498 RepID=A0A067KP59_JATCU|nr:heavy metal-associated isoprenylated plant protein 35 [Jatropha curcas]KDP37922.1 hypothetical protein JCGZ_05361 [Jatropha curcas]
MTTKKSSKKMKGFMCQSRAATAICTAGDPRSMIVPRTTSVKYSRLAEPSSSSSLKLLPPATSRSVLVSSIKKQENDNKYNDNDNISNKKKSTKEYYKTRLPMQKPPSVLPSSDQQQVFQVVVMRVSLHCQGCAGKVKKHLSKMEGVSSFSIDLETKRVTVMGRVSPVGVLESISKVKPAEFWPC